MEKQRLETLVLAALLHDIGKFAQRAGRPQSAELIGEYCPHDGGRPTHTHVLYTDHVIEKDLPLPEGVNLSELARLASSHHKPAGGVLAEQALCRADRLSAGMDRIGETEVVGDYKSSRLLSTFCQIALQSAETCARRYYPLLPIDEDAFPRTLAAAQQTTYAALYVRFLADAKNLPLTMGLRHYLASLDSLLEMYTWCIPSSTYKNEPDISLYDHATTTAAIAQALYAFHSVQGGAPGESQREARKFILLGGDLSGIQSYIFGLEKSHGAGVAKILRARSFYLQALTRSVILSLLDACGLCLQARIMDAGGRFVLLLPATDAVKDLLPEFEARTQAWFFETFKGRLTLNLTYELQLTEADFDLKSMKEKLDELSDSLEARKLHKFDMFLASGHPPFAEGIEDYAHGACAACRVNPVSPAATRRFEERKERSIPLCQECAGQILDIGGELPTAPFLVYSRKEQGAEMRLFDGVYGRFENQPGQQHKGALDIANLRERGMFSHQPVAGHVPDFSEEDVSRWRAEGRAIEEEAPVAAGSAKTFGHLAEEARLHDANGLRGKAFLGAFKADVDNLGQVFGIGLQKNLSISRFAGLSRLLNHFFSTLLVAKVREEFPNLYVVFAGGDDLFLLGPWTQVVEFASALVKDFRRYVADNPEITLCAGLLVSKPQLPAHTIAREVEDLLECSKKFMRGGKAQDKNAFTLFDVTRGWEEYDELLQKGRWIENLVLDKKAPAGLVRRLLHYADSCRAFKSGNTKEGLYLSHMAYDFKRNLNEKNLTKEEISQFNVLRAAPDQLELMRLPISYALYRLRNN